MKDNNIIKHITPAFCLGVGLSLIFGVAFHNWNKGIILGVIYATIYMITNLLEKNKTIKNIILIRVLIAIIYIIILYISTL